MRRTGLIRLGGVATMAGAVSSYAIIWTPEWLANLQLSVMVFPAIAALHALHRERERYGWPGTLASLVSFVGLALIIISWPLETTSTLSVGLVLATGGLLALGPITMIAEVLPWWCGAALIVGSPPFAVLWPLVGVPWIVVGYAIFRAGGRVSEQPSRVR